MTEKNLVRVYTTEGKLIAESIRLMLESFGISAVLIQESIGATYGFTVGPMGEVHVYVPAEKESEARELLKAMDEGSMETPDNGDNKSYDSSLKPYDEKS
jgi:hypothetical protein